MGPSTSIERIGTEAQQSRWNRLRPPRPCGPPPLFLLAFLAHSVLGAWTSGSPPTPGCRREDAAAFAARQDSRKLLLCHCAGRKRSEDVVCATVRRECLRRRQFAFIGPPAPCCSTSCQVLFTIATCPVLLGLPPVVQGHDVIKCAQQGRSNAHRAFDHRRCHRASHGSRHAV